MVYMIQHMIIGSHVSESGLQTSRPGPPRLLRATDEGSAKPRGDTHLLNSGFYSPYDGKAVFLFLIPPPAFIRALGRALRGLPGGEAASLYE